MPVSIVKDDGTPGGTPVMGVQVTQSGADQTIARTIFPTPAQSKSDPEGLVYLEITGMRIGQTQVKFTLESGSGVVTTINVRP